jgi:hypothetical protein
VSEQSTGSKEVKTRPLPSKEYLSTVFSYNEKTGELSWKSCLSPRAPVGKAINTINCQGYVDVRLNGVLYRAHRIIWKMVTGEDPVEIDHIDGVRSNNVFSNLRSVSSAENSKNQRKRKNKSSNVIGVSWYERDGNWDSRITVSNKVVFLGRFATFEEAVAVRKAAEKMYGFHKNHGKGP